jgi:peptidyl-prolyl cis-trans isomerase A (cyclophilin A)
MRLFALWLPVFPFLFSLAASAMSGPAGPQKAPARRPGLYAIFDTSMGAFVCELYEKQTPKTVARFVGLADGTREWLSPKGEFVMNRPFYDGVIFHRVIKKFMIQAGDVTGSGSFQSVIPFEDEIVRSLTFGTPGVLAMANAGPPNTNTSQFFITVAPAPHLNGLHTIFGKVVEGYSVVESISNVQVLGSKPAKDVAIKKLTIERVGKSARQQ